MQDRTSARQTHHCEAMIVLDVELREAEKFLVPGHGCRPIANIYGHHVDPLKHVRPRGKVAHASCPITTADIQDAPARFYGEKLNHARAEVSEEVRADTTVGLCCALEDRSRAG